MTNVFSISAAVLLLAVSPAFGQEGTTGSSSARSAGGARMVGELRFIAPPSWRRVRLSPEINLGGDLAITAVTEARNTDGTAAAGLSVTLFARSPSGPVARGTGTADGGGTARLKAEFRLPVMSSDVTVQACATADPNVCTPVVPLQVSRRIDVQLGIGGGYTFAPLGAGEVTATSFNPYVALHGVGISVIPRVVADLWRTESGSETRGLSLYGSVPILYQHLSGEGLTGSWFSPWGLMNVEKTIGSSAGVGAFQAGSSLQLSRSVLVDVAYVGPLGSRGILDGLRQFGSAQPISFGGGAASLDLNVSVSHNSGDRGPGFFLFATASHAFERSYSDGRKGHRGNCYEAAAGPVFLNATRYFALAPWAGFAHQGLYSVSGTSANAAAATEESSEARLGVTLIDQRGGAASAQVGAFLGWPMGESDQQPYFSVSLLLSFRDLLRIAR